MRKPHAGLVVVAFLSYWILTAKRKGSAEKHRQDEKTERADAILDNGEDRGNKEIDEQFLTKNPRGFVFPLIVGIGLGYVGAVGVERITDPRSYDDCILESMPSAQTWQAAALIKNACSSKYKDEPKTRKELLDSLTIVKPKKDADPPPPMSLEELLKEPVEPIDNSNDG